jgi:hypothetical protein
MRYPNIDSVYNVTGMLWLGFTVYVKLFIYYYYYYYYFELFVELALTAVIYTDLL